MRRAKARLMVNCCFSTLEPQGAVLLHCSCKSIQGWEEDLWRTSCIAVVVSKDGKTADCRQLVVEVFDMRMNGGAEEGAGVRLTLSLALPSFSPLLTAGH